MTRALAVVSGGAVLAVSVVLLSQRDAGTPPRPAASTPARTSSTPARTSEAPPRTGNAPPASPATGGAGVARVTRDAVLRAAADASAGVVGRLRAGVVVAARGAREGFVRVLTPCEREGWIDSRDVSVVPPATGRAPRRMDRATVVIDPGHGGASGGAVGPTGLVEADVNLAVAHTLQTRLEDAGATVVLTRASDHPATLGFRSAVADAVAAHAFVSIHHNAEPDGPSELPGTETYYQRQSAPSRRLAGLAYEEVLRTLSGYAGVSWAADRDAGAKYRTNARGEDYYAVLRQTAAPTVLVEAAFVSNPDEERLLRRTDVRDSIAAALHASLRRFFTTSDTGSGFVEPYAREAGPSGRLPACVDPA